LKDVLAKQNEKKTQQVEPVAKRYKDGCTIWDCELIKETADDKYGFSHSSGKTEIFKGIGLDENSTDFPSPKVLFVRKIAGEGLLLKWNEAHDDANVQPGDRILSVNGATTAETMSKELKASKIAMEIIRYPEEFDISLSKKAGDGPLKKLGFKFEKPANEEVKELKITEVGKDGCLWDSNLQQAEKDMFHNIVMVGMRIVQVNNISDDANKMKEELKSAETVNLRLRRAEVYALARAKLVRQAQILAAFTSMSKRPEAAASASKDPPS